MKKIYLTLAATALMTQLNAQFWTYTTYKGAFPVTDGLTGITSNDWTAGWTNWDPQNASYGAPTTTVSADITTNTTWTTGSIVSLVNKVYVKSGATLTIQPGVIIRGDQASQGSLIIETGSKIMAMGTQTSPIVFTSDQAPGFRAEGDWGGVILLGLGITNNAGGIQNIEGIPPSADTQFGGTNNADNSGVMQYVRIEYAGIPLAPNKEINGLTFGAVGSGTTIEHIQVSYSGDDSYEWFGGAVNCKYLISLGCIDDDFDTDNGFQGHLQFGLSIREANNFDAAGDSNGYESDNDATGDNALPRTAAIFSNFTHIGPTRNGTVTLPGGATFERSTFIRRNSDESVYNSLMCSWPKGVYLKDLATVDNFTGDTAHYSHNVLASDIPLHIVKDANSTAAFYSSEFTTEMIDTTTTIAQINWVNPFPAITSTADYRLNASTTVNTGTSFPTSVFTGGFMGIEDVVTSEISNMVIYPNPANNVLNVKFNLADANNAVISIIDLTGKVIYNTSINAVSGINNHTVSVANFNNGVYFVKVTSSNLNSTVKFIKN